MTSPNATTARRAGRRSGTNQLGTPATDAAKRFKRVALRLRDWSEWCRQVVRGVQRYVHSRPDWRLHVDIGQPGGPRATAERITFDGIVTGVMDDVTAWRKLLRQGRTKVVALSAVIPAPLVTMSRVQVNDAEVARAIGRHLLAGGFRRLAYVGTTIPGFENARRNGIRAFAEAENCAFDLFEPAPDKNMLVPPRALARWIAKLPKPVGIAAWNMTTARTVLEACKRAGVAVPEQVAVVAWDDDPMLAETLEPTISAIVLPAERVGYEAAKLLGQLIDGQNPKSPVVIPHSGILHVRQSSDVSTLEDRNVHLAVQYIDEHAAEPLKVSKIAAELRISRRKLEQDFLRVTGKTLHTAIVQVRLERAKQLLLETDWRIERVAERSGMGSVQTLIRHVVANEGMTPGEYRNRFSAA